VRCNPFLEEIYACEKVEPEAHHPKEVDGAKIGRQESDREAFDVAQENDVAKENGRAQEE
jgi:hypothetical protein